MDKTTIEQALDANKLSLRMDNGNIWKVRRNGKTQTWQTRPNEFRIPIKMGYRSYSEITHTSTVEMVGVGANRDFIITE